MSNLLDDSNPSYLNGVDARDKGCWKPHRFAERQFSVDGLSHIEPPIFDSQDVALGIEQNNEEAALVEGWVTVTAGSTQYIDVGSPSPLLLANGDTREGKGFGHGDSKLHAPPIPEKVTVIPVSCGLTQDR
jgi:hypothetical protein